MKRNISRIRILAKQSISHIIFYSGIEKLFHFRRDHPLRILMYHEIGHRNFYDPLGLCVSEDSFTQQLRFLHEEGYKVIPLEEGYYRMREGRLEPGSVVITFDDGYRNALDTGVNNLARYNFPATFFLTTEFLHSDKDRPEKRAGEGEYATWEQVRTVISDSLFTIGSHGVSHRRLTELSQEERMNELSVSKSILEEKVTRSIDFFSFPHGAWDREIRQEVERAEYLGACSSIGGGNTHNTDCYLLRRTEITGFDTLIHFREKMLGCYDWTRWFHEYRQ